jgi:hypothetical protein
VASELIKRRYEVAFTMGNHPETDLVVLSENKRAFVVDVKGLYKRDLAMRCSGRLKWAKANAWPLGMPGKPWAKPSVANEGGDLPLMV